MEKINQLDFDPVIITKKDLVVIATASAAFAALVVGGSWALFRKIKNK